MKNWRSSQEEKLMFDLKDLTHSLGNFIFDPEYSTFPCETTVLALIPKEEKKYFHSITAIMYNWNNHSNLI